MCGGSSLAPKKTGLRSLEPGQRIVLALMCAPFCSEYFLQCRAISCGASNFLMNIVLPAALRAASSEITRRD